MIKHQGSWEPADTIVYTREEGPTVQLCGDSEVAGKWISGQYSLGQMFRGTLAKFKNIVLMVEKEDRNSHLQD